MQKKSVLALLLVVILMITCSCSLIEKDLSVDRETVIIKVGDKTHTKGEIQDNLDYQLDYLNYLYSMYGMRFDANDPEVIADVQVDVINAMIEQDVKEAKVAEQAITLNEEEDAAAVADADAEWDYYRSSTQSAFFAETELTGEELDAAIDAKMAELGYDHDKLIENARKSALLNKLQSETVKDITVTEEELQAKLDENVESAKASYESNLSAYGTAFNRGTTVYYRPAGYRLVKQILVKFTDEDQAKLDDVDARITENNNSISSLTTALTEMEVEDVEAALAGTAELTDDQKVVADQLKDAKAQAEALTAEKETLTAAALANIDEAADEIIAQLNEGADWDALMAEKTQDPGMQAPAATAETGYAVCADMSGMDVPFVTASMALEKVGDVSPKTAGMYGYYIIKYVADVEEGPVALDAVRGDIEPGLLNTKQSEFYEEKVAEWVNAANATIDTKALAD